MGGRPPSRSRPAGHRSATRRALPLLAAALLPWGARAQAPPADAPACYDVRLGAWDAPPDVVIDSLVHAVPPRVVLRRAPDRDLPGPSRAEVLDLAVSPGGLPTPHVWSTWRSHTPDSATLTWSTGYAGVAARVAWTQAGFTGVARATTHVVGPPVYTAPIRGGGVPCDAPLRWRESDQRPLLRGLPLVGGGRVELWARPDTAAWSRTDRGSFVIPHSLAGAFAGAESVTVVPGGPDRVVARIQVRYAGRDDYGRLLEHLIPVLGPPGYTRTMEGGRVEHAVWENRTETVRLGRAGARAWFTLEARVRRVSGGAPAPPASPPSRRRRSPRR